tara:strand:+ start:227 stop:1018 length:792 start_codon:yes stop_codon:yes gene_type:complete
MITWIASYPKSGNTWVRSFLSNYLSNNDNFNFGELKKINKFPKDSLFKELNVDKNDFGDIARNWIPMQTFINLKNEVTYLKTHNAMMTINNFKFTDIDNTNGFIYLIRDPRDVLVSYASHMSQSFEETFEVMIGDFSRSEQDGAIMSSWSTHYNSWKNSNFDKIIIKYEDLIENTEKCFNKIVSFLNKINNLPIDSKKIKKSILNTSFNKLKKLEENEGFNEAHQNSFFRKGKIGDWKENLDPKITKRIEEEFNSEMKELGYL